MAGATSAANLRVRGQKIAASKRAAAQRTANKTEELLAPDEMFTAIFPGEVQSFRGSANGTIYLNIAVPRATKQALEAAQIKGRVMVYFGRPPLSVVEAATPKEDLKDVSTDDDLRDLTVTKLTEMLRSDNTEIQLRAASVIQNMRAQKETADSLMDMRANFQNLLNEVRGDAAPAAAVEATDHPAQTGDAGTV